MDIEGEGLRRPVERLAVSKGNHKTPLCARAAFSHIESICAMPLHTTHL